MIKSFRHKGLERFFSSGNKKGIRPEQAQRLKDILFRLQYATRIEDMDFPGSRLHRLKGDKTGVWSVTVNGDWRVLFCFEGGHAHEADYDDYH